MRNIIFFTLTAILNICYSQESFQKEKKDTITYDKLLWLKILKTKGHYLPRLGEHKV
jgi:hypothetical protein